MSIKIIFNDVDECLSRSLPSNGIDLNANHLKDISAYANFIDRAEGVEFVLCTGRALYQLEKLLERVRKIRWIITENGSIINNLENRTAIDLGLNHSAKETMVDLMNCAGKFAEEDRIPKKKNMVTIDVWENKNPEYFNSFIKAIPLSLMEKAISEGISFNWDPTSINISLPISKYDGVSKLLEIIAEKRMHLKELREQSAFIGDSTSDIEGMKACHFAATISNGDEKNKRVQEYILRNYADGKGYISKYSYAKGNLDCINYLLKLK